MSLEGTPAAICGVDNWRVLASISFESPGKRHPLLVVFVELLAAGLVRSPCIVSIGIIQIVTICYFRQGNQAHERLVSLILVQVNRKASSEVIGTIVSRHLPAIFVQSFVFIINHNDKFAQQNFLDEDLTICLTSVARVIVIACGCQWHICIDYSMKQELARFCVFD